MFGPAALPTQAGGMDTKLPASPPCGAPVDHSPSGADCFGQIRPQQPSRESEEAAGAPHEEPPCTSQSKFQCMGIKRKK
eukprot:CAMPEP_0178393766 /NCGR_PEP_ID=MMETSP0689_2-20121128/12355_1 /TAXON_ID=160604 /ORGANISM="Amphidinium massartii, Strain CS-259" /LENGTH=78 /DNA_ID=CAMNT_0020014365 /DNA_START=192 /DNA_END=425 /DNA_ORIENTATION=+